MSTPSLSAGVLSGIYIAPSGLYTGTGAQGSLASVSARVDYPGLDAANHPAPPVQDRRNVTIKLRLTFQGGSGGGQFQVNYSCVGSERDPSTSGWASIRVVPGGEYQTRPNEVSPPGWLPAARFKYDEPLEVELTLSANAIADVQPQHPGPVQMTAESHLIEVAGLTSSGDPYPLSFVWKPVEIAVTVQA